MRAREIGGYFELERFDGMPLHHETIALNSGRGCLAYLVELRGIRSVLVPDFMCASVAALFMREGVTVSSYPIGIDLKPDYKAFEVAPNQWMLLADYYGQLESVDVDRALGASSGNLIVDESQGYYRDPWENADTFYCCRKWFGVSDGAYLATHGGDRLNREVPVDESHDRMAFVLGRFERPASEYYEQASVNNGCFAQEPPKVMSRITENILRAIDYDRVKEKRDSNWDMLDETLGSVNELPLNRPDGAFMYPLMVPCAQELRRNLISDRIYVPCLWPDVVKDCPRSSAAWHLAHDVVPLPVDQRYGMEEMAFVIERVRACLC